MTVVVDSDVSLTIETLLKENGYSVISVANADECITRLKSSQPNLILVDGVGVEEKANILEAAKRYKKMKVAYLIRDRSEQGDLKLYSNVVGFVDEPRNIREFLKKIKEMLK